MLFCILTVLVVYKTIGVFVILVIDVVRVGPVQGVDVRAGRDVGVGAGVGGDAMDATIRKSAKMTMLSS